MPEEDEQAEDYNDDEYTDEEHAEAKEEESYKDGFESHDDPTSPASRPHEMSSIPDE